VRLVVTGIPAEQARAFLARRGISEPERLELAGVLSQDEFGALLSRARVFLSAARWEDFGLAPLEALDRGAVLACAPGGGPFPALTIARELEPRFIAGDRGADALAGVLEAALGEGEAALAAYREGARKRLEPYRPQAIVTRMRDEVLPVLLGP
jgi:glycosyltransferase involved in cell wall biosynthesis